MRLRVLLGTLLLLAICGCSSGATGQAPAHSPTPAGSGAFPSPSPGGPPAPSPLAVTCTSQIPAAHELALVTLRNTTGVIVRDISDISNPVTRCVIKGTGGSFHFVDGTHISYTVNLNGADGGYQGGGLFLVDLNTLTTSLVRSWSSEDSAFPWIYAWSPDGRTLAYLSSSSTEVVWHVRSAAGDLVLSRLGPMPARGVDPDNDDAMVGFSADGQFVALEQTFIDQGNTAGHGARFQVVRLSDHKLVYSRTDGTMATWAGAGAHLYFRISAGVEAWDPTNGVQLVVAGLSWSHPWPSADGLRIAYTTGDGTGNHHVGYMRLADQPAAGNQLSFLPRAGAAFLNSTLVWYAEEAMCSTPGVQCGLGGTPLTGRTYIRDLVTGTESASIDTAVFDSWPHVGAS